MNAEAHPDIRITQPFKDIYLINPYSDTSKGLRSPRGQVDLIVDGGPTGIEPTSVIDLTSGVAEVLRQGRGDVSAFL